MIYTELERLSNVLIIHQPEMVFHTMCTVRGRLAAPEGKDRADRQGGQTEGQKGEVLGVASLKPRAGGTYSIRKSL